MKSNNSSRLQLGLVGLALALPVGAQSRQAVLEEVVVTAQKQAESLSDVPLAVSAFSQESMEKLGSTALTDSVSLIPNMQRGNGGITIRGIGTTSVRSTTPTVAIQVDGIYTDSDPRGLSSNLDIQRVEVLRGPQGTLYGRNATAGVINLFTGKPGSEAEVFGDIEFSTGNTRIGRVVVSGPVSDSIGLRLAVRDVVSDGRTENTVQGQHDADAPDTTIARLTFAWQPVDSLYWHVNLERSEDTGVSGTFIEEYYVSKPDSQTAIVYDANKSKDEVPSFGDGALEFGSYKDRQSGTSIRETLRSSLQYDIGEAVTLTWLFGMSDFDSDTNTHSLPPALVDYSLRGNTAGSRSESYSHELNLSFDTQWGSGVAGLYQYRKTAFEENVLHIWTPTPSSGPEAPPTLSSAIDISNQQFEDNEENADAVFAQLTVPLGGDTRVTGGIRYSRDEIRLGAGRNTFCQFGEFRRPGQTPSTNCQLLDTLGLFGGIFGPTELPAAKQNWDDVSWKATVDHDIGQDVMVYATLSTGYKQGGIPGRDQNGLVVVKPETNRNYEVGMKATLYDGAGSLNLTLFTMDYDDLQVNSSKIINGAPGVSFDNAGKARSRGAEAELSWQLTPFDRVDGYITWLDAVITEWSNAPDAFRGEAYTFDAAGYHLPNAPEYSLRLSYTHIFELGIWGELSSNLSTYYAGESYSSYTNGPQDFNAAYWRSDLFLRYVTQEEGFTAELFVNNIEDGRVKGSNLALLTEATDAGTDPTNPAGSPGGGIQWSSYSAGRTMGARLGFRF